MNLCGLVRLGRVTSGVLQPLLYPVLIIFLLFCAAFTAHAGDNSAIPRLFFDSESKIQSGVGRFDTRVRTMQRESFALLADGHLESLFVPVPDEDVLFLKSSFTSREGTSTWIGQDKSGKVSILLTLGEDHLFARVITPEGSFVYRPQGEPFTAVTYEENTELEIPLVDDAVPVPAKSSQTVTGLSAKVDDGSRIDMMVAYTNGLAAVYPGSQINTRIQYLIDLANLSFQNSGINTWFNLVHSQAYAYTDDSPGDMSEALENLTDNSGIFAGVEAERSRHGADQVTLLRKLVDEGCGMAWVVTADNPDLAYAVVHDGVRSDGAYCSEYSYVHEVGHNLGCAHDRANASVDGRFDYSYGYQDPESDFRTIMAYSTGCAVACPRIPYFSNPDILYNGEPTGVASTDSQSADNAMTINQTRIGMAGYMAEVNAPPVITPPSASSFMPLPAIKMILDSP